MRKLKYIALFFAVFAIMPSCENWLSKTASSQVREEDQFNTPLGFQQALIGCYMGMCEDALYGKMLTWYMSETMARQFELYSMRRPQLDYDLQNYRFNTKPGREAVENVWMQGYDVIANANNAIKFIDLRGQAVLDPREYKLIKGELHAIRAYMHFDLLRWFGYGKWEARNTEMLAKLTLPYVKKMSKDAAPQSTGSDFMKELLADIKIAEELLADVDPVLKKHDEDYYMEVNMDGFFNNRRKRLNYFAVLALKARVLMWEGSAGSKREAGNIAKGLIEQIKEKEFTTWQTQDMATADRILSKEALFMLNVKNLSSSTMGYIKPVLEQNNINTSYMYFANEYADELYEKITVGYTDWRYSALTVPTLEEYRVPVKYYQDAYSNVLYKNLVPLIRLSELYYMASEMCVTGPEPDLPAATEYLNEVRKARGIIMRLEGLTAGGILDELTKEYKKEFVSEGVVFLYYKRRGFDIIPRRIDPMTDAEYVLPYPDIDKNYGYVQ